jgi:hypothetical protein
LAPSVQDTGSRDEVATASPLCRSITQRALLSHAPFAVCQETHDVDGDAGSMWSLHAYTHIREGSLIALVRGEVVTMADVCASTLLHPFVLEATQDLATIALPPYVFPHPSAALQGAVFLDCRRFGKGISIGILPFLRWVVG